jgi:hypothetical protein
LNRKAFNKAYVNLMTGFSTRIIGKNRWEWVLGPELSFNTSRLIDNPYERKQYLMYTGFSARLLFPGKKK